MLFSCLHFDCQLLILDEIPLEEKFTTRLVSKGWKMMLELVLKGQKTISTGVFTYASASYSAALYREKDAFEPGITSTNMFLTLVTKYCPNLKKLSIELLTFDTKSLQQLAVFLTASSRLTSLELICCPIELNVQNPDELQWSYSSFVRSMSNLTSLKILTSGVVVPYHLPVDVAEENKCNACSEFFGLCSAGVLPKLKHLALDDGSLIMQPGCGCIHFDGLESIEINGLIVHVLEPYLMAAVRCQSIKSLVFVTDAIYEQCDGFTNSSVVTLITNSIRLVTQFTALQHITLSRSGASSLEEIEFEIEGQIKNIVRTFQGQLKTLRLPPVKLDEKIIEIIGTNCLNLEILHFGYIQSRSELSELFDKSLLPGFTINSSDIINLNKLTKLIELGLDCFLVEQDEQFSLKELELPNLRSLSLCRSSFALKPFLKDCFEVMKRPNLTIHVECTKIDVQDRMALRANGCKMLINHEYSYTALEESCIVFAITYPVHVFGGRSKI